MEVVSLWYQLIAIGSSVTFLVSEVVPDVLLATGSVPGGFV